MASKNEETARLTMTAVACAGSVDSGKSSLLGVLMSGELDDGNGKTRECIAKHPHEKTSGKTSDISTRSYPLTSKHEAITFVDVPGHEDYFKTTISLTGHFPDYAFLIVSGNRGVLPMTKQHLRLLLSLSVPLIVIITHIDMAPEHIYEDTKKGIELTLKKFGGNQSKTLFVNDAKDFEKVELLNSSDEKVAEKSKLELEILKKNAVTNVLESITNTVDGKQITFPVISLSNVTGFFIDVLKDVLECLTPRKFWSPTDDVSTANNKVIKFFKLGLEKLRPDTKILPDYETFKGGIFYIDSAFNPIGIGLVVTGINRGQSLTVGNNDLLIGPFGKEFKQFSIKSMHNNMRQPIQEIKDHCRGCMAISKLDKVVKRDDIKKGMVILTDQSMTKNVCYRFKAAITVFEASITLKSGYSPVINMYTIRQTARMVIDPADNKGEDIVRSNNESKVAYVTFKFKSHPEVVYPYDVFLFRSGNIQGLGCVTSVIALEDDIDAKPDPVKIKRIRRKRVANKDNKGGTKVVTK